MKQNKRGRTALMFAARFRQLESVRLLLHEHCDPDALDTSGFSAADWLRAAARDRVLNQVRRGENTAGGEDLSQILTPDEQKSKSSSMSAPSTLFDALEAKVGDMKLGSVETEIMRVLKQASDDFEKDAQKKEESGKGGVSTASLLLANASDGEDEFERVKKALVAEEKKREEAAAKAAAEEARRKNSRAPKSKIKTRAARYGNSDENDNKIEALPTIVEEHVQPASTLMETGWSAFQDTSDTAELVPIMYEAQETGVERSASDFVPHNQSAYITPEISSFNFDIFIKGRPDLSLLPKEREVSQPKSQTILQENDGKKRSFAEQVLHDATGDAFTWKGLETPAMEAMRRRRIAVRQSEAPLPPPFSADHAKLPSWARLAGGSYEGQTKDKNPLQTMIDIAIDPISSVLDKNDVQLPPAPPPKKARTTGPLLLTDASTRGPLLLSDGSINSGGQLIVRQKKRHMDEDDARSTELSAIDVMNKSHSAYNEDQAKALRQFPLHVLSAEFESASKLKSALLLYKNRRRILFSRDLSHSYPGC